MIRGIMAEQGSAEAMIRGIMAGLRGGIASLRSQ